MAHFRGNIKDIMILIDFTALHIHCGLLKLYDMKDYSLVVGVVVVCVDDLVIIANEHLIGNI